MGSATLQGHLWGGAAHDWAELQEPAAAPLWEAMLTAGGVGPGTRLLDAGCGAGGASVLAADRGALVNGVDAAASLVAIARQRVPDGDFQVGDLEALPYGECTFDVILVADVLPYTGHPVVAVRELARVCRPGGWVVVAVWSRPEDCAQRSILRAVQDLVPRCLGEEAVALSAPGAVEGLLTDAGLLVLGNGEISCPCAYPDREMAWRALASTGAVQAALRLTAVRHVRPVVLQALTPYMTEAGALDLAHWFRYVAARAASVVWPGRQQMAT